MAMNGERELNRGHPVPASSTKRKEEDAGCVLGSDLKLVEVRAWPPLTTPSPVPHPHAFPIGGVAETRKAPSFEGDFSCSSDIPHRDGTGGRVLVTVWCG